MVVHAKVRVTELVRSFREREQIIQRALLVSERDERKMGAEFHLSHEGI